MFNLNQKLVSSTCVAERSVGEGESPDSTSPCPTCPQISYSALSSNHPSSSSQHPTVSPSRTIHPRKPQTGWSIANNELRPHVAAADRIFDWDTPWGAQHRASLNLKLPSPLVQSAFTAIWGALAPNTRTTYGAGPLRFTQFCDKWSITEEARMPAEYPLLCAFIGEHLTLQSGNTIRSWLSGLRSWHIMHHAPWYGDDDWVRLARVSANNL